MEKRGLLVEFTHYVPAIPFLTFYAETDIDVATRLISLEDDPTLPAFTFRLWFLGLGLSCFGAVLGQIFVSNLSHPLDITTDPHFISTFGLKPSMSAPFSFKSYHTSWASFWRKLFLGLLILVLLPGIQPFGDL
jgi:hypothetical protein